MDLRRALRRSLLAAPLVAGGAFALALPSLVRDAVAQRITHATGLPAHVASASLGWSSVVLRGVTLGGAVTGAMDATGATDATGASGTTSARIDSVEISAGPLALAWSGASAAKKVIVQGVRGELYLHKAPMSALLARARAVSSTASSTKPSAQSEAAPTPAPAPSRVHWPEFDVREVSVVTHDAHGPLVELTHGHATLSAQALELKAAHLALGPRAIELKDLDLGAQRMESSAGFVLRRARVARARMVLPSEADEDSQDPSDDASSSRAGLAMRILEVLPRAASAVAPSAAGADGGTQDSAPDEVGANAKANAEGSAGARLMRRLAPLAELSVARGTVLRADGSEALSDLVASAKVEPDGALRLRGTGQAGGGGAVRWDLRALVAELRVEGSLELKALPLSVLAPLLPSLPWHEPESARVDASLRLVAESPERIALSGEVGIANAALRSARIASTPVRGISLTVGGRGHFEPGQRTLTLESGEISLGATRASIAGSLQWSLPRYVIDLALTMPKTRCTEAVRSIPNDLLGDLALASWQGSLGGSLRVKIDSSDFASTVLDIAIDDRCDFVTVPALADLRRFQEPFVHEVLEPDGTVFQMETGPGTSAWTYLTDISPFFVHAVLAHEDAGFYAHKGFSPLHIKNALARNLEAGRYVVGASTITMQLVKNVFLHREKTLARKIQEVLLTWWIERVMDKSDILELYFNVIEYGPGVYGIRDACRHYFGRLPSQLSPAESAFFATILPSPKRYHAQYERGQVSSSTLERMRRLIVRLKERGAYGPSSAAFALQELANFRFARAGQLVAARELPRDVGVLPHMQGDPLFGGARGASALDPFDDVLPAPLHDTDDADDAWEQPAP